MKSHDVNNHGASGGSLMQGKKPWVTPSLQVIALESAEGGTVRSVSDNISGHSGRAKS